MDVILHDKTFEPYISEDEIQDKIRHLALTINSDYKGKHPVVLSILNGSFIFTADLVRYFDFPMAIEFVRYSSYEGMTTTGSIVKLLNLKSEIVGRDVLIVEDIIDTGLTLTNAIKDLKKQNPASIKVVSLLLKPEALKHPVSKDYIGFEIPNEFVVGYGLDYDELGRDLPAIYKVKEP